jgi:hypothetical protein
MQCWPVLFVCTSLLCPGKIHNLKHYRKSVLSSLIENLPDGYYCIEDNAYCNSEHLLVPHPNRATGFTQLLHQPASSLYWKCVCPFGRLVWNCVAAALGASPTTAEFDKVSLHWWKWDSAAYYWSWWHIYHPSSQNTSCRRVQNSRLSRLKEVDHQLPIPTCCGGTESQRNNSGRDPRNRLCPTSTPQCKKVFLKIIIDQRFLEDTPSPHMHQ